MKNSNLQTVQDNYARFVQGDIPGIIDTFTDDAVWSHVGDSKVVPFFGTFNGKAGLADFFQKVGDNVQVTAFQPMNFRGSEEEIITDLQISANVIPTGKNYDSTITVKWQFNGDGKATSWAATGDVASVEAAFQ